MTLTMLTATELLGDRRLILVTGSAYFICSALKRRLLW